MIEYKFPTREEEAAYIKGATPDNVGKLRDAIKFRLEGLLASCDDYFENLIESDCYLCNRTGYGYFDLPPGWGWVSGTGYLLCDKCIGRWTERFGAPEINREGEIVYEQNGSFSQNPPRGGQTDFGFV